MKPFYKRTLSALLCAAALTLTLPMSALAARTVPVLTEEMGQSSYWTRRSTLPQTALVSAQELEQLKVDSRAARGTGLRDLSAWAETTYDGAAWAEQLREDAMDRAWRLFRYGARFDGEGTEYTQWSDAAEQMYVPMIENAGDSDADRKESVGYAICTTPGYLRSFPAEGAICTQDGRNWQKRSRVLLGEPLIVKGESEDGRYVYAYSGADSGWLRRAELALCYSRDEWLRAWQYPAEETLVVYGDGVLARPSEDDEEGVSLSMGTCLQMAELEDYRRSFRFDSARPDFVVWLPRRTDGGFYDAQLAVVSRSDEVSQGYLPLSAKNLADVALKQPQNGTLRGGQSDPEDCTGYARTLFRCFGVELSRSVSTQSVQPVRRCSLKGLSDEEKAVVMKRLPLGTLLCTKNREFFYLGHVGDTFCIIHSAEDADGGYSASVDTLDSLLPDDNTILSSLTQAVIPWYNAQPRDLTHAEVSGVKDAVFAGKDIKQSLKVTADGVRLEEGVHYTLSYANNDGVGEASVTIRGKGNWKGKLVRSFTIRPASVRLTRAQGTKGGLEAQWEKKNGVAGYQLRYSAAEDFSDAVTVKVRGKENNALRVDNLERGTWYVRVRSYAGRDGKRYTSDWSETVRVSVK